jgi:hypothetical protein
MANASNDDNNSTPTLPEVRGAADVSATSGGLTIGVGAASVTEAFLITVSPAGIGIGGGLLLMRYL